MAAAAAKQAANEIAKQRQADPKEVPGFEEWMKGAATFSCNMQRGDDYFGATAAFFPCLLLHARMLTPVVYGS